ncbi:DUF6578 domain-containing protein [Streptomyces sp. NPDC085932]|uniref:DUF6578 domain-containing protein n=1 Tax=Streptomyces sp. NPDC085932 TaxID=3365741 RepID=UPI0037D131EC
MGLRHVIHEDRRTECCGTPFAVGDEGSRPLLFADPDTVFGGDRPDRLTEAQALSQACTRTPPGSRTWEPVAGERRPRTVRRSPEWFAEEETERGRQWRETGALATLDAPDGAPSAHPRRAVGPS